MLEEVRADSILQINLKRFCDTGVACVEWIIRLGAGLRRPGGVKRVDGKGSRRLAVVAERAPLTDGATLLGLRCELGDLAPVGDVAKHRRLLVVLLPDFGGVHGMTA